MEKYKHSRPGLQEEGRGDAKPEGKRVGLRELFCDSRSEITGTGCTETQKVKIFTGKARGGGRKIIP